MAKTGETSSNATESASSAEIEALLVKIVARAPKAAVDMLSLYSNDFVVKMLTLLNSAQAQDVLEHFPAERRQKILRRLRRKPGINGFTTKLYPERSIGHMMELRSKSMGDCSRDVQKPKRLCNRCCNYAGHQCREADALLPARS